VAAPAQRLPRRLRYSHAGVDPGARHTGTDEADDQYHAGSNDVFSETRRRAGEQPRPEVCPVGDVDFCIWLTRVQDFDAFAKAVGLKSTSWRSPGFVQGADHPVVNVTWVEAVAFCKWLTDQEHKEGSLPANSYYRLPPTSNGAGPLGCRTKRARRPSSATWEFRSVSVGTGWPPPPGAGNYTGEETGSDVAIKGYDDGFAWTSPVGSFKPNKYGLYDMGGNVWQWCMDNWNAESKAKVLRGASWYNGALKLSLLSSCRVHAAPDSSTDNYGFRIVRSTTVKKPELR